MEILTGRKARLVVLSIVTACFFTVSNLVLSKRAESYWGLFELPSAAPSMAAGQQAMLQRIILPPARKAILVSPDGMSQKTGDHVWMVRKDRSRVVFEPAVFFKQEVKSSPAPVLKKARRAEEKEFHNTWEAPVVIEPLSAPSVDPVDTDEPIISPEDFKSGPAYKAKSVTLIRKSEPRE